MENATPPRDAKLEPARVGNGCSRKDVGICPKATILVVVLTVGVLAVVYFLLPHTSWAGIRFRLMFDGAAAGTYPSGVPFSPQDVISMSVLNRVYQANHLDRHGTFDDFRQACMVSIMPSPSLLALDADYSDKLAKPRLTIVDRTQLETEYLEKRKILANSVEYVLNLDLSLPIMRSLTGTQREKVLRDILAAWADDVAVHKGAMQYQVTVLSEQMLPRDKLQEEDSLVAADMLRAAIAKVQKSLEELMALPGAKTYRLGGKGSALGDLRSQLESLLQFQLNPLIQTIARQGSAKEPQRMVLYLQGQIQDKSLACKEASDQVRALTDSLMGYLQQPRGRSEVASAETDTTSAQRRVEPFESAMIPQLGETFLDRLVELTSRSDEVRFRQSLSERISIASMRQATLAKELSWYQDVLRTVVSGTSKDAASPLLPPEEEGKAAARLLKCYDELIRITQQIQEIHAGLSTNNLVPQTLLYLAGEPMVYTEYRYISRRLFLFYAAGVVVALGGLTVWLCRLVQKRAGNPAA